MSCGCKGHQCMGVFIQGNLSDDRICSLQVMYTEIRKQYVPYMLGLHGDDWCVEVALIKLCITARTSASGYPLHFSRTVLLPSCVGVTMHRKLQELLVAVFITLSRGSQSSFTFPAPDFGILKVPHLPHSPDILGGQSCSCTTCNAILTYS